MRRINWQFEDYPDYFCWLSELVCADGRYTDVSYWMLAKILWDTDFIWCVEMDECRAEDGIALRQRYAQEGGTEGYSGPCTVLEMLVALADRMDQMLDELDGEYRLPIYFWEMIDNLGLSNYSDSVFEEHPNADVLKRRADRRIDAWLYRHFDYDGTGGLFPLQNPRQDQREVDIWYQMNAYLIEHYN